MDEKTKDGHPVFYGSTSVGERGQVVIPAEARRDMDITPSTKLLVMGGPEKNLLIFVKAEFVATIMSKTVDMLNQLKDQI